MAVPGEEGGMLAEVALPADEAASQGRWPLRCQGRMSGGLGLSWAGAASPEVVYLREYMRKFNQCVAWLVLFCCSLLLEQLPCLFNVALGSYA